MANHTNKNRRNRKNVVSTKVITKVEETNMSESKVETVADLLEAAKLVAKEQIKNKTANKSEKALLQRKINKEKKEISVALGIAIKAAGDNELLAFDIMQQGERELKQIDIKYQPQLKAMTLYTVEIGEAAADVIADKITAPIAPVTRAASAGVKKVWGNLFGKK